MRTKGKKIENRELKRPDREHELIDSLKSVTKKKMPRCNTFLAARKDIDIKI